MADDNFPSATEIREKMISSFTEITSSSKEEAKSFLETHQWDLDAAVSTFTENKVADAASAAAESNVLSPSGQQLPRALSSNLRIDIPHSPPDDSSDYIPSKSAPSPSRLRSRSPSPPSRDRYPLLSQGQPAGNIRTSGDTSGKTESDSDDEAQEYYGGGDQSGTMVQDPKEGEDDDTSLNEANDSHVERPIVMTQVVTLWRNGFTIDDSPLRTLDNPEHVNFVEAVQRWEFPREYIFRVNLIRRQEEDFPESPKPVTPFQGVGRTLAGSDSVSAEPPASSDSLTTAPLTSMSLVVDPAAPTTSIQLRLADGTSIVSQFNTHHTVRDIRGFIDESRPDGSQDYQLLIMGFPPKPLPDLDQTIENAGISNSVLVQK